MSVSATPRGNLPLAVLAGLAVIVFVIGAIYYWTQQTSLFASSYGLHHKHALVAAALAVVALVAANFMRPKSV